MEMQFDCCFSPTHTLHPGFPMKLPPRGWWRIRDIILHMYATHASHQCYFKASSCCLLRAPWLGVERVLIGDWLPLVDFPPYGETRRRVMGGGSELGDRVSSWKGTFQTGWLWVIFQNPRAPWVHMSLCLLQSEVSSSEAFDAVKAVAPLPVRVSSLGGGACLRENAQTKGTGDLREGKRGWIVECWRVRLQDTQSGAQSWLCCL